MATVATLVYATPNRLRYQVVYSGAGGTTVTITTTGAATPDILTDSVQGPLKKIAKAFTDGYGQFAAGALTQAQARNLYLHDFVVIPNPVSISGNHQIPVARCTLSFQDGAAANKWAVDANVDGGGHPTITVSLYTAAGTAGDCFLDVEVPEAIG